MRVILDVIRYSQEPCFMLTRESDKWADNDEIDMPLLSAAERYARRLNLACPYMHECQFCSIITGYIKRFIGLHSNKIGWCSGEIIPNL